jgi:hypothetical protein
MCSGLIRDSLPNKERIDVRGGNFLQSRWWRWQMHRSFASLRMTGKVFRLNSEIPYLIKSGLMFVAATSCKAVGGAGKCIGPSLRSG